jgi:hypothetical protein
MKYFCFLLGSFILCLSSCKKNNEEVVMNDGLSGKWQLTRWAEGIGNGSFAYYYPDAKKPQVIEFKKDSSFTANINSAYLKDYNAYGILNSRDLKFLPDLSSTPPNNWGYKTSDGTGLTLYMHMVCIEGCFFEYKAIR